MRNHENRIGNRWPVCMYDHKSTSFGRQPLEGDRTNSPIVEPNGAPKAINVLVYLFQIILSFSFCAVYLLIDSVTNKWLWNIVLVIMNVALDIFIHLVLALAAVMVVLLLNIDNNYQEVKDETVKELDHIYGNNQELDIEKETCPNLV